MRTLGTKRNTRPKRIKPVRHTPLLGVALVCVLGLLVLFFTNAGAAPHQASLEKIPEDSSSIAVAVPGRTVAQGEALSNVPFRYKRIETLGAQAYVQKLEQLTGMYARAHLPADLPVLKVHIGPRNVTQSELAYRIPPNMRAVSVPVPQELSAASWLRPGSFIDVIHLPARATSRLPLEANIVADNVEILDVRQAGSSKSLYGGAKGGAAVVTVLASQRHALAIQAAARVGQLSFSLRGTGDEAPAALQSLSSTLRPAPRRQGKLRGVARGPDGEVFVLNEQGEWRSQGLHDWTGMVK